MNEKKETIELSNDDDEPINPDSVSDSGGETKEIFSENKAKSQSDEGLSAFSGEAELKPRTDFPLDDRY